jgi:tRNA A-37 threonylcarbamoyl transferase component Bud32
MKDSERALREVTQEIANYGVVIAVLAVLGIIHPLLFVWSFTLLLKPWFGIATKLVPQSVRGYVRAMTLKNERRRRITEELNAGMDQARPFVLFTMYISCMPIALLWMLRDWTNLDAAIGKLWRRFHKENQIDASDELILDQSRSRNTDEEQNNFYHSRAFAPTCLLVMLAGIPALICLLLYANLHIDHILRSSALPIIHMHPALQPSVDAPLPRHDGYYHAHFHTPWFGNPRHPVRWPLLEYFTGLTLFKVFFVQFYLFGVAAAMSVLFMRSWWTFPLKFMHNDHKVRLDARGISQIDRDGWFFYVITLNNPGGGTTALRWSDVKLLHTRKGHTRLYPLPEVAFKRDSVVYKLLNKLAAFIDGVSHKNTNADFVVFSNMDSEDSCGRRLSIDLSNLNREQRAKLLHFAKQHAPQMKITKQAEELLLGSSVLSNERYTQIWFDLLTATGTTENRDMLQLGHELCGQRFVVERHIASGGQATAYLARKADGEACVLKEFILSKSDNGSILIESASEFEAEASLLSQLDHSHVVQMQEFFADNGRAYLALEYVEGESLRKLVKRNGALPPERVREIALQLCDVLYYLHSQNPAVVHRDITPENIIMQPDGSIKVIDFSLALKQEARQTTDSCGKHAYTPPEQFRDEACAQSDIYALGATLHYLLTGQNPKPLTRSSPASFNENISEQLSSIVERATEMELKDRYESVEWMRQDLTSLVGNAVSEQAEQAEHDRGEKISLVAAIKELA